MYRGILQHRVFMTTFLRKQVIARGLDTPVGLGRIYRVVPDDFEQPAPIRLSQASDADLVAHLQHKNGFWRDTAQRLLVERRAVGVAGRLRSLALRSTRVDVVLHALWTLDGLDELRVDDVLLHTRATDTTRRLHALRLLERFIDDPAALGAIAAAADDDDPRIRAQAVLSLGEGRSAESYALRAEIIVRRASERPIRSAMLSGLGGQEAVFLGELLGDPRFRDAGGGRGDFFKGLVGCILRGRDFDGMARLLELAAISDARWQTDHILSAVANDLRLDSDYPKLLHVAREPEGFLARGEGEREPAPLFARVAGRLRWPGRDIEDDLAYPWTDEERARRATGEVLYRSACLSCHQEDGRGQPGVAPTLVGTPWVLGPKSRLTRILLHGLAGPIVVDEQTFNADMPRSAAPTDEQIAAILTYVRDAWGNNAAPISPQDVADSRRQTQGRRLPWTARELLRVD